MRRYLIIPLIIVMGSILLWVPAFGQQTGSISGKITLADETALPGVVVEAAGDVLPRPRSTASSGNGEYKLPLLPPGNYELTFTMDGMATVTRSVQVLLQQNSTINVVMGPELIEEEIEVFGEAPLIDVSSAELKTAIPDDVIVQLPVGQEYRDLVKLIPGVQYTEDGTRGPSAGGSGQDNVYQFDGVNVALPLFGTLSAEPSSHDIDQIAIVKGGAKALDFNRSGGFSINSVSKSGTNVYHGQLSYQIQTEGMTGQRDTGSAAEFDEDKDWSVFSVGGPLVPEHLYFYTSYYRPTASRGNRSNLYGDVPDLDDTRNEFFGKLSFNPTSSFLLHASYRDSDHEIGGASVVSEDRAGTASEGQDATLEIAILEGSWVLSDNSFLSFKYTDFANETASRPDNLLDFGIRLDGSLDLDIANLEQQGLFSVPQPIAGLDAYNTFIQPLIDRYGFLEGGVPTGGGLVGVASTLDNDDFFRESFQVGWDYLFGGNVTHELHFGYQWASDEEDLSRTSNGWGLITVPGGRVTMVDGTPIFYQATFQQMSIIDEGGALIEPIHSEFETQSFEINDTIQWKNWTFNVGVLVSNDQLYGQGLRENSSNLSGFELAPGNKYKMYEVDWNDMIQPRLGAIWAYNGQDTVYANYARYHPAASSLPRAASWARNLRRSIEAYFDADGNLIGVGPVGSSSGKFFADDLNPRYIDEFLVGTSKQLSRGWTGRAHARYRYAANFWEDTNNNARLRFEPPEGVPEELYIDDLDDYRDEVGGSSYVIAELDGAFTKYYETNLEAEWRGKKTYFRGSYVWSHYYGNFDQDNSTTANDANVFIGSSFIADGAGRQLWDFRYGDLRGDRRHQLKLYGYYNLPWNASAGFFAVYQSGQPWEAWDSEVYRHLTSSTSDVSRYGEPAGSRTTSNHYQIDLSYTQTFKLGDRYNIQVRGDVFNVLDKQTGYNIQNRVNSAGFGDPRSFFDPRRFQLMVKFQF